MENEGIIIIVSGFIIGILIFIVIPYFKNQCIPADLYEKMTDDDYSNVWEQIEIKKNQKQD